MNGVVQLALPCRLVALKVLLGPESGLTTLEDLVARAIAAGRTTVEGQVDLFRLPERIMVDVVHSLWSKGHVLVRFDTGDLDLTDGARDMLTSGGLRDVAAKNETRRFLFEPVTGQFFPEQRGVRFAPEGNLELPAHHGVTEADLSASDLLEAVQSAIHHDRRRTGFRQNVLDVGFGSPVLRPPDELRWLAVRVSVRIDSARDVLSASLIDDEHMWGMRARQRMAEHLTNLAQEQPEHEFVRKMTGQADRGLVKPETLESLLARMADLVAELPEKRADQVGLAQKQLSEVAVGISERIADTERGRAAATLIERAAGYTWAVEELIGSAATQLVISSPLIRYSSLNHVLSLIGERLAKGVGLVVLWGRTPEDTLASPVLTALNELKTRYRTQVVFDERSSQTDACIVVQDGCRALFGSQSPLAVDPANDQGEIGVLVEPTPDGQAAPRCIADALVWARKTYPFAADGARIQLQPEAPEQSTRRRAWDPADHLPAPDPTLADEATVRLWADSWMEYHAAVTESIQERAGRTPSVELVRDSAHRNLVASALTTHSFRLAIADDRIDPRVANDVMARRIKEIAKAGAVVHLVHPSTTVTGNIGKAFTELLAAQEAGIHVQRRKARVRGLLSDDSVLLGSFSPLSEGAHAKPSGRISQVGVQVRGLDFADAFATALGIPLTEHVGAGAAPHETAAPGTLTDADSPAAPRRSRAAVTAALPLLEQAKLAQGPDGFTSVVGERISQLDDPWHVLERWQKAKVPTVELRRGVALVLGLGRDDQPEQRERWASWLVADAWQRRAFVEAAVVGRLLSAADDAAACTAATALEVGPINDLLLYSAVILEDSNSQARVVGTVAGMAEALLWGGAEGGGVTGMFKQSLPSHWQRLAEVAAERQSHRPLPMKWFSAELAYAADQATAANSWADLSAQIDHIEKLRRRFDFDAGVALHDGLFMNNGLLTAIRASAADQNLRAALRPRLPDHVKRFMDDLVHGAGKKAINWRTQASFLRRIEMIVRTAQDLVSAEAENSDSAAHPQELHYCRRLGTVLTSSWDDLFSEAGRVDAPYRLPMIAFLERLRPLHDWTREQR